jgi:hypothetical protein
MVHHKMDECWKALSFYERAVEIGQRSLQSNYPDLQQLRVNLELVKKKF